MLYKLGDLRGRTRRIFHIFQQGFRWGVLSRLGVAALAVITLVVAANVLTQGRTIVVRTEVRTQLLQAPATGILKAAAGQLEHVAQVYTEGPSAAGADVLRKVVAEIRAIGADYLQKAEPAPDAAQRRELDAQIDMLAANSSRLIRVANEREKLWTDYWQRLEALETRLKAAMDGALHIFGRVLARQSLMKVSRRLARIRELSESLARSSTPSTDAAAEMAVGEAAFLAELAANERSLTRSQGAQWLTQMRQDFSSMVDKRIAVFERDAARRAIFVQLSSNARSVSSLAGRWEQTVTLEAPPTVSEYTESTDDSPRTLVAWISAGVLAVLLVLAIGAARQLNYLARHDSLTQLPNRRQLLARLKRVLKGARRGQHWAAVFFVDLDNFKIINDSLGHEFGDRVLGVVAERLTRAIGERGFAARLGGDEFTVVLRTARSRVEIDDFGALLSAAFQHPIVVDERELLISASIGASVYPEHGLDIATLLRAADAALFQAKELGRSRLAVFSSDLLEAAASKFEIEQGLRHAIERGEFELVFQPEISLDTRTVEVAEALLRWRQPCGRIASPGEFLAVAEQTDLVMRITDWVMDTAMETAARLRRESWPQVRIAINISPRQLFDGRLADRVAHLLKKHDLPARCIELELTENVLQTGAAAIDTLQRLRALDVAVALDDFGTGYSFLASLQQLPLTRVKLDRSLIKDIDTSSRSAAIAHAIVAMCGNLGLKVTAEGIETPQQLAALARHTSITLQGYLLCKPVSATELLKFVPYAAAHLDHLMLSIDNRAPPAEQTPASTGMPSAGLFKHSAPHSKLSRLSTHKRRTLRQR